MHVNSFNLPEFVSIFAWFSSIISNCHKSQIFINNAVHCCKVQVTYNFAWTHRKVLEEVSPLAIYNWQQFSFIWQRSDQLAEVQWVSWVCPLKHGLLCEFDLKWLPSNVFFHKNTLDICALCNSFKWNAVFSWKIVLFSVYSCSSLNASIDLLLKIEMGKWQTDRIVNRPISRSIQWKLLILLFQF